MTAIFCVNNLVLNVLQVASADDLRSIKIDPPHSSLRSEILCNLPLALTDRWTSVLLTGNLAMFDSSAALESWTISNRCRRFYDFLGAMVG